MLSAGHCFLFGFLVLSSAWSLSFLSTTERLLPFHMGEACSQRQPFLKDLFVLQDFLRTSWRISHFNFFLKTLFCSKPISFGMTSHGGPTPRKNPLPRRKLQLLQGFEGENKNSHNTSSTSSRRMTQTKTSHIQDEEYQQSNSLTNKHPTPPPPEKT